VRPGCLLPDELVISILDNPPDRSHKSIADESGVSPFTVQRIRTGRRYKELAPHLPRHEPSVFLRSCVDCKHWAKEACVMGIPESAGTTRFAPACSAFADKLKE